MGLVLHVQIHIILIPTLNYALANLALPYIQIVLNVSETHTDNIQDVKLVLQTI